MSAQEIHAHTRPPSPPAPTRRVRALAAHLASYEDIQAQDGSAAMAGANAEVSKTGSTARNGSRALQVRKLLIANRGEIALRIIHSTSLSAYSSPDGSLVRFITVAIHTPSEAQALHVLNADDAVQLPAEGPRAYLDRETIVKVAKERGVWGIAPGYGFLSEDPAFAELCESQGIVFVGPTSSQLALFGDKTRARALARSLGVPLLPGTSSSASLSDVSRFASSLPNDAAVILKAVAGGGGRGMRVVRKAEGQDALRAAYESCEREAQAAFGDARLYAERYLEQARHVEVQIVGDGTGEVAHLWERECSLQRRHQKLVEIAPSPSISPALRKALLDAAMKMAREGKYRSLGTFEFLVPAHNSDESANLFFMEANPRIQVEHTVTEEITHLDLVALQLGLALGASLSSLGLGPNCPPLPFPSSTAIQVRINAESFTPNGEARPESGAVTAFVLPTGRNVRVDTAAHAPLPPPAGANSESGPIVFTPNPAFDSLLAKMIVSGPSYEAARALAARALAQTHIRGTRTNRNFLRALLAHENVVRNDGVHTAFLQARFEQLFEICQAFESEDAKAAEAQGLAQPGTQGDAKSDVEQRPEGTEVLFVEMTGLIVSLDVHEGQEIQAQQQVALIEAMKMEHVIRAPQSGTIVKILLHKGSPVQTGQAIFFYKPSSSNDNDDGQPNSIELDPSVPLDHVRPDLRALQMRKKLHTDEARPEAVRRRHGRGHRTARENLKDLVDPDSFIELGDLALAAQRGRMSEERLMKQTPGDGVITGWATINSALFPPNHSGTSSPTSLARCAVVVYDYSVLAGTQGHYHHLKLDRLFASVLAHPAPLVLYAEGGGGRPGDTDVTTKIAGLDTPSFALMASLRARGLPTVGVANGYVFAGNAALLGCCDCIIATRGSSIGMGGPAMIEGGGLGVFKPGDVGPSSVQHANGTIDILVADEASATVAAKQYISYFQGNVGTGAWRYTTNPLKLRHLVPEDRKRAYDVRPILNAIADDGSVLELRAGFGHAILTALARIEGRSVGIIASRNTYLGGALDVPTAQKATRFLRLCTQHCIPLVVLADTPGFMVGPDAERQGGVRAFADWFVEAAGCPGPVFAVTLRKGYGLGAQAMLGGSTLSNFFSVAWPSGEFGAMGLEGAVRLGMRKELEAIKDPKERQETFESMVAALYDRGRAENMASAGEIDSVIDPGETRSWIIRGLRTARVRVPAWRA